MRLLASPAPTEIEPLIAPALAEMIAAFAEATLVEVSVAVMLIESAVIDPDGTNEEPC